MYYANREEQEYYTNGLYSLIIIIQYTSHEKHSSIYFKAITISCNVCYENPEKNIIFYRMI